MRISELRICFDSLTVRVDELDIAHGRIYGLIGPNGCGKTTLLKAIGGIQKYAGIIDYDGLSHRDVIFTPRKPYILHRSVEQNIAYPLNIRGIKLEQKVIATYLAEVGLEGERYAPSLSSGEQQKLALLRALIFRPKLILIDEALSSLDIESVGIFERMIRNAQKSTPATVILVSHQLAHIHRLCDYVFFMNRGKIEAEGTAKDILLRPENEHLKRYLRNEAIVIR